MRRGKKSCWEEWICVYAFVVVFVVVYLLSPNESHNWEEVLRRTQWESINNRSSLDLLMNIEDHGKDFKIFFLLDFYQ